jgi:hypothetical protein
MGVETRIERYAPIQGLWGRLEEASRGHFDPAADISRIRALLDQGCDLEADIVPTVARTCPSYRVPSSVGGAMARAGNPGVARAAA